MAGGFRGVGYKELSRLLRSWILILGRGGFFVVVFLKDRFFGEAIVG